MATERLPMRHVREIQRLKWTLKRSHRETARRLGISPGWGAAWLFGVFGGIVFERWRDVGTQVVPAAIAVPAPVAEPSSTEPRPKKLAPTPLRGRPRAPQEVAPLRRRSSWNRRGTWLEQGWNSGGLRER
jgi:hypothetical protein